MQQILKTDTPIDGFIQIQSSELLFLNSEIAGLGSRSLAFIIDSAIKYTALFIIIMIAVWSKLFIGVSSLLITLAITLMALLYHCVFEYLYAGKTPGKSIVGIRVLKHDGSRLSILDVLMRNILRLIDMMPMGYFIAFCTMVIDKKHRRFGDLAANTIVVFDKSSGKPISDYIDSVVLESSSDSRIKTLGVDKLSEKEKDIVKTLYLRIDTMGKEEKLRILYDLQKALAPKIKMENVTDPEIFLYEIYKRL